MKTKLFYTLLLSAALIWAVTGQPPTTSDLSKSPSARLPDPAIYPGRAPVYVPPHSSVCVNVMTNREPLVWRETVTSNVCFVVIWTDNGRWNTNEVQLTNHVISCTTNSL